MVFEQGLDDVLAEQGVHLSLHLKKATSLLILLLPSYSTYKVSSVQTQIKLVHKENACETF